MNWMRSRAGTTVCPAARRRPRESGGVSVMQRTPRRRPSPCVAKGASRPMRQRDGGTAGHRQPQHSCVSRRAGCHDPTPPAGPCVAGSAARTDAITRQRHGLCEPALKSRSAYPISLIRRVAGEPPPWRPGTTHRAGRSHVGPARRMREARRQHVHTRPCHYVGMW